MFGVETRKKILKKSNGLCARCGVGLEIKVNMTVDHVLPKSKGGSNDFDNLVALCWNCNKNKGDKIVNVQKWYRYLDVSEVEKIIAKNSGDVDVVQQYFLELEKRRQEMYSPLWFVDYCKRYKDLHENR